MGDREERNQNEIGEQMICGSEIFTSDAAGFSRLSLSDFSERGKFPFGREISSKRKSGKRERENPAAHPIRKSQPALTLP